MKIKILLFGIILVFTSCHDLNLNPLSEGSTENWYSNEIEINMALNNLYKNDFWILFEEYDSPDLWTDDYMARTLLSPILLGTLNGESNQPQKLWTNSYKPIARANTIVMNLEEGVSGIPDVKVNQYKAEARFVRAYMYSRLISFFGDVPFYDGILSLDEAFTVSRTNKSEILDFIYDDFDYAAANLPESYSNSELKRATKGAALALKARIALYMGDFEVARDAAKACMNLGVYELYPDYRELFLSKTKDTKEEVFGVSRSIELEVFISYCRRVTTRNTGGLSQFTPTWDLFFSYLCTDGLPVDESPLFNPRDPFKNRDPRCLETVVDFQTEWLGFMYQPHPDSINVLNFSTGKYQKNNDTRKNTQYASYNGLVRKKGVDEDWSDDLQTDPTYFVMRYADVLLMYAEAKIELNEIDQSVRDAINQVRARAYKVNYTSTGSYPAVTEANQAKLRKIVRTERRMELAFEELRYMDLIRWRLAEKALNTNNYGMLDVAALKTKVITPGLWFFPAVPDIDEDGMPNFDSIFQNGLIKLLSIRTFHDNQYLWPVPSEEILINENINQNVGY